MGPPLEPLAVPAHVLGDTRAFLAKQGRDLREGVALWTVRQDSPNHVQRVVFPVQEALPSRFGGCVVMPLADREDLTRRLHESGEHGAVQVHSHPRAAFHSETDAAYPMLHHRGAYSVVVPNFARAPLPDLQDTAVFRLEAWPDWHELTPRERATWFQVIN